MLSKLRVVFSLDIAANYVVSTVNVCSQDMDGQISSSTSVNKLTALPVLGSILKF